MYPRITQKVFGEPWLITAAAHRSLADVLLSRLGSAGEITARDVPDARDPRMPHRKVTMWGDDLGPVQYYQTLPGGVARITSLRGVIGKRLTAMELDCGACSLDHFMEACDRAFADPAVSTIILDFDSPGGTVQGTAEAARHFAKLVAGSEKQVVGFVETMACSAAQWILAHCPIVACTPSADLGSIGVYWWRNEPDPDGRSGHLFQAGKYKAAGLRPLTEEEIQQSQETVDRLHAEFKAAIWAVRPAVPEEAMEGQVIEGWRAIDLGLADILVDTFQELLQTLGIAAD